MMIPTTNLFVFLEFFEGELQLTLECFVLRFQRVGNIDVAVGTAATGTATGAAGVAAPFPAPDPRRTAAAGSTVHAVALHDAGGATARVVTRRLYRRLLLLDNGAADATGAGVNERWVLRVTRGACSGGR